MAPHTRVPAGHTNVPGLNARHAPENGDWHGPEDPRVHATHCGPVVARKGVVVGGARLLGHSRVPPGHRVVRGMYAQQPADSGLWHGPEVPTAQARQVEVGGGMAGVSTPHWNAPWGHRVVPTLKATHAPPAARHGPDEPPAHAGHTHAVAPAGHAPWRPGAAQVVLANWHSPRDPGKHRWHMRG
jgi:hypothetical protein